MKTKNLIDIDVEAGGFKAKIKKLSKKLYIVTLLAGVVIAIIALIIVYFIYENGEKNVDTKPQHEINSRKPK